MSEVLRDNPELPSPSPIEEINKFSQIYSLTEQKLKNEYEQAVSFVGKVKGLI